MSIAETYDMPAARAPLVPPIPPRAPDDMTVFGRVKAISISPIGSWGRRAYEEEVLQGRFLGRSSFILNAPDAKAPNILMDVPQKHAGITHIALKIDDLTKVEAALATLGVTITGKRGDAALFVRDPDGNVIELATD